MNKRNTMLEGLTSAAFAAAAFAATAVMPVRAGDIYSIEPVWGDEMSYRTSTDDCSSNPLTRGEQATFIFRLYDSGVQVDPTARNASRSWKLKYKGTGSVTLAELSGATPKIGVYVSGTLKYADIVDVSPTQGGGGTYALNFTDIKCRYTVQGGDIALPLTLADAAGQEVGAEDSSASYYFLNTYNWWAIEDDDGNAVTLSFGQENVTGLSGKPQAKRNYSLASIDDSIYIRAVDFDDLYDTSSTPVYWRRVYEGMTATTTDRPSVYVPGGNATNETTTLYLWVEDTNCVRLVDATLKYTGTVKRGGTNVDLEFPVQRITLERAQTNLTFLLQGVTAGTSAQVFLAATPGYRLNATGDIITNFVTRTVYCETAPDPFISITFAKDETEAEVQATTNYQKSAVTMYVKLSKPYTSDLLVDLNPTVVGDATFDVFANNVIGISPKDNNYNSTFTYSTIKVPAGETQVPFYVYALGATAKTAAYEGGITFTPTISDTAAQAFFNGDYVFSRLRVTDQAPQIESYNVPPGLVAQSEQKVTIDLNDNYRDLLADSTYTVTWSYGDGTVEDFTLAPTNRALVITVKYPSKGAFTTTFTVADQNGNSSEKISFNVDVLPPRSVAANLYDSTAQAVKNERQSYAEGEKPILKFELSQPHTATVWAYLVPLNEASSNLVSSAAIENGVVIPANSTLSTPVNFTLNLLDGCDAAADIEFGIMLRNDSRFDRGDEVVGIYTPETLYLNVTNLQPVVSAVEINNGSVANGATFESMVSSGVPTKFEAVLFDASMNDITNEHGIVTYWKIRDGMAGHYIYKEFYETNYTVNASCTYTFATGGETQLVTVKAQDKDMAALDQWGPEYSFYVQVDKPPYVQVITSNADKHYAEDSKDGYIVTTLSTPASEDLVIEVTAAKQGMDGILTFVTNYVTVAAGDTYGVPQNIRFADLDGTLDSKASGFLVTARVITETKNAYGQKWSEYYKAGTEYVYVDNVAPIISKPAESAITNKVTLNSERVFNWSVKDIAEDLTNGLTVTWTSSGGEQTSFTGPGVATGSFTNVFNAEGPLQVSMLVEDKDGGQAIRTWFFVVNPTKQVTVNPYGPSTSTLTKYDAASGRGMGRIWGNSGTYEVEHFRHTWFYDVTAAQAQIHAFGYAASNVNAAGNPVTYYDDGTLNGNWRDVPLTAAGNKWATAVVKSQCYPYRSPYDNFFYCWIDVSQTACLDTANVPVSGVPHPATSPLADTAVTVTLDAYEEDKTSYEVRNIEAIFARELYTTDNMGDINADGIPDIYYKKYWYGGAIAGGEGGGGEETDDLTPIDQYNEDGDYLPGSGTATSRLIPGLQETWVTEGMPFTASLEIRGFGAGLNEAPSILGLDGTPERDYVGDVDEFDTTDEIEWMAYNEVSPAERAGWTPESPSDPTKDDTDGDGFSDGYEYYFWYYAKVGYMENGRHVYLTGSRYNPADPSRGDVISSAEIIELFNPNHSKRQVNAILRVAQTRDSDNDGLSDLREFYLGTNPLQWDTDGDGLPDGYEILIGMNPLTAATTPGQHDAHTNPDGDYMAYSLFNPDMGDPRFRVFGVEGNRGHVHYVAIREDADIAIETTTDPQYGYLVSTTDINGNPVSYLTLGDENGDLPYDYNDDGEPFLQCELDEYSTWVARLDDDGNWVRGNPTFLPRGTVLTQNPDPTVEWYDQVFAMFWARNSAEPNHAWHAWKYGKDVASTCPTCQGTGRVTDNTQIPPVSTECPDCDGTGFVYDDGVITWGNYMLGYDLNLNAGLVVLFEVPRPSVGLVHHYVYQWRQFDPRTGWGGPSVNTRPFATYDEFLLVSFFYNTDALNENNITPTATRSLLDIWGSYNTNPLAGVATTDEEGNATVTQGGEHGADTDSDGIPDGWELYVMSGPKRADGRFSVAYPTFAGSPLVAAPSRWTLPFLAGDDDGLNQQQEFEGVESTTQYSGFCPSIQRTEGWTWYNKRWPTDPWSDDTDDDGISDSSERAVFAYGTPRLVGAHNGAIEGGGLNPLSWDTDGDGLPDPWEAQYAGTATAIADRTGEAAEATTGEGAAEVQTMEIVNGMDGTSADATTTDTQLNVLGMEELIDRDYDHDGLQNWQEYQTGWMRCWRYDDPISPWGEMPVVDPDSCDWGQVLMNRDDPTVYNPHLTTTYDPTAYYGSLQTNAWDVTAYGRWYMFCDGPYHELSRPQEKYTASGMPHNRWTYYANNVMGITLAQVQFIRQQMPFIGVYPERYFTCSPTSHDSDGDGMDDYYETFHGMNPILGIPGSSGDLIFVAYGGQPVVGTRFNGEVSYRSPIASYDFVYEPWLAGVPTADPDGDNIRNQEEAIMPRVQALSTWHHTDPTPLWMTDLSYGPGADVDADPGSLTARFYMTAAGEAAQLPGPTFEYDADGDGVNETYEFAMFFDHYDERTVSFTTWQYSPAGSGASLSTVQGSNEAPAFYFGTSGVGAGMFYSFEQNEGYDSDHDGLSDYAEAEGKYRNASDGQDDDSPVRHQAMYFNGTDAFLETLPEVEEDQEGIPSVNMREMMFLEYTVEAWVKAEDPTRGAQTVVERAIATGPSHVADSKMIRRNFSIGIDANGRWCAKHDSRGTDAYQTVEVTGTEATTEWTHVAATFGAKAGSPAKLTLYVNGTPVNALNTDVQPENGTSSITINANGAFGSKLPYDTVALLVGTGIDAENDIVGQGLWALYSMGIPPDYQNFTGYFKGYVDELRIWDGARSSDQIASNYKKRFVADDIRQNRARFYYQYRDMGVRSDAANEDLEPELRYLFGFDHSFGADAPEHVATVPGGFVFDGVDGKALYSRPVGYVCPWWAGLTCASTVYTDRAWVPWINNMFAHLDRFDGTTKDSRYWSKYYAGITSAGSLDLSMFSYPQTHEVYSYWTQVSSGPASKLIYYSSSTNAQEQSMLAAYEFTRRQQLTSGADLLPFGGAFAKYVDEMWDDGKASSMWELTGTDQDNDGLPDWWEAAYGNVGWNDVVTYNGVDMTAGEAYKRSLAVGAHEGSTDGDDAFAQGSDLDKDGIADWWEQLYKIEESGGNDDSDQDGLSNYSEYVISEAFRSMGVYLSPVKLRSDDVTLDYFRTVGYLYLGEMFTDHDMMEDDWERSFGDLDYTSPWVWDANTDKDEDGWSSFAECRYHHFRSSLVANLISHIMGEEEVRDFPRPTVRATFRYHGSQKLESSDQNGMSGGGANNENGNDAGDAPGATIIVNAYANDSYNPVSSVGPLQIPDATFSITPGESVAGTLYLGAWEDRVVHVTFGPGFLNLDSLEIEVARVPRNDSYAWTDGTEWYYGTYAQFLSAFNANPDAVRLSTGDFEWMTMNDKLVTVTTDETGVKGYICFNGVRAGQIDLQTGEASIDLAPLQNFATELTRRVDAQGNETQAQGARWGLDEAIIRMNYSSKVPTVQKNNLTVSLAKPDKGYLREGLTTFVAFADIDGDGAYTAGEPMGLVRNVDVGWGNSAFEIELTDVTPVFARIKLDDLTSDREILYGTESGNFTNLVAGTLSGGKFERLRVIRTMVDGVHCQTLGVVERPVLDTWINLADCRNYIFEGDFLNDSNFDIDWEYFTSEVVNNRNVKQRQMAVTNVMYRIVLGNGSIVSTANVTNNLLGVAVSRTFDTSQTSPTPVSPLNGKTIYSAQPTFEWSMGSLNTYTAFRLRVFGGGVQVYDSGILPAPARNSRGNYEWTPPLYANSQTPSGKMFYATNNYTWAVSMYNSKYQTDLFSPTVGTGFRMNTNSTKPVADNGYTSIGAKVSYYGPGKVIDKVEANGVTGKVRVQVFSTPDFAGYPVAETVVTDKASLTSVSRDVNALVPGLPKGEWYVRAYIDTNGNFKRDAWESWGYACNREGTVSGYSRFSPVPVVIDDDTVEVPTCDVYIEDCDTDGDWFPDAYEMVEKNNLTTLGPVNSADGLVNVNANLATSISHELSASLCTLAGPDLDTLQDAAMAALILGVDTTGFSSARTAVASALNAQTLEPSGVTITGISVEGGKVSVTSDVEVSVNRGGHSEAMSIYTGEVSGQVVYKIWYKKNLTDAKWTEIGTQKKTLTESGEVTSEIQITGAIDPESGFFKVTLE